MSNRDTPQASYPAGGPLFVGMDMATDGGDSTAVAFIGAAGVEFVLARTTKTPDLRRFLDTVTAYRPEGVEVVVPPTAKARRRMRRLVERLKEVGYAARA